MAGGSGTVLKNAGTVPGFIPNVSPSASDPMTVAVPGSGHARSLPTCGSGGYACGVWCLEDHGVECDGFGVKKSVVSLLVRAGSEAHTTGKNKQPGGSRRSPPTLLTAGSRPEA